MTKGKMILLILVPTVLAGGIIYWQVRKYYIPVKTAIPDTGGKLPLTNKSVGGNAPTASAPTAVVAGAFPLQQGSKNPNVGQLQDALGVTIDNSFGPQTAAALLEQAGLVSISSLAQLNQVIASIISNDEGSVTVNTQLSNDILSAFQGSNTLAGTIGTSTYTYLQVVNATVLKQVEQDADGWYSVGYQLPLSKGKNIPLATYQPTAVDADSGNLILTCVSGSNAGLWSANPNDLVIV